MRAISQQTVIAGKTLTLLAGVENPTEWKGKLRYSLSSSAPRGAKIDSETGRFTWTPLSDEGNSNHEVTVFVEEPDGRRESRSFAITITWPPWQSEIAFDLGGGVKLEMVPIPAGELMMGSPDSDKDALASEKPQHRVRITRPFYLGKYLVTQEQWQAVMGYNPSLSKGPKNPVETVSWHDCQGFVERLNRKLESDKGIFTLPTEAQWEYACRAGGTTKYWFGDDGARVRDFAWQSGKHQTSSPRPVGEKKPNAWGLYDMYGSVWQWCQDWYDENYYAESPVDDPTGPAVGRVQRGRRLPPVRVMRGHNFAPDAWACRSAARFFEIPRDRFPHLGVRVVLATVKR